MAERQINYALLKPEMVFTTSRSSGPGGQNVNKANSRVSLSFDIKQSAILTEDEKNLLLQKLHSRLTKDGALIISAQEKRSQLQNKEEVIAKFDKIIAKAFEKKKPRKATKPSKGAIQDRIKKKKLVSEKKKWRQKPI